MTKETFISLDFPHFHNLMILPGGKNIKTSAFILYIHCLCKKKKKLKTFSTTLRWVVSFCFTFHFLPLFHILYLIYDQASGTYFVWDYVLDIFILWIQFIWIDRKNWQKILDNIFTICTWWHFPFYALGTIFKKLSKGTQ